MANSKKGQNYFHGAAILTVGVIIMKILGAVYKIPLGNILGDEGYSMFMGHTASTLFSSPSQRQVFRSH